MEYVDNVELVYIYTVWDIKINFKKLKVIQINSLNSIVIDAFTLQQINIM